jgi:FkbM family methyltransferase
MYSDCIEMDSRTDPRKQLEELLKESVPSATHRERCAFDELASPVNGSLVLFGAGGLGLKTLNGLTRAGIKPLAFADNKPSLWGTHLGNLPVLSPEEAAHQYAESAAFVVTIWRAGGGHRLEHTRRQLQGLGCTKVISFATLFWKFSDIFLPYYALGLPHLLLAQSGSITRAYGLLADHDSRKEYLAQIRWRLRLDFDGLPSPAGHRQYFADDLFDLRDDEVFVDCGAYDGDSLREFFGQKRAFKGRYIAIEPDPVNLNSLKECVSALEADNCDRVSIFPVAVGRRSGTVSFEGTGLPSSSACSGGSYKVRMLPLDEILQGLDPTFIKMDIEGAEMDALAGARRLIGKSRPILAISAYHRPDHLWRIPLLIGSISKEYSIFMRPHNEEGWDLVCYAVPRERLKLKTIKG